MVRKSGIDEANVKLPREVFDLAREELALPPRTTNKEAILYLLASLLRDKKKENFIRLYNLDEGYLTRSSEEGLHNSIKELNKNIDLLMKGTGYTHRKLDIVELMLALNTAKTYRGSVEYKDLEDEYNGVRVSAIKSSTKDYLKNE